MKLASMLVLAVAAGAATLLSPSPARADNAAVTECLANVNDAFSDAYFWCNQNYKACTGTTDQCTAALNDCYSGLQAEYDKDVAECAQMGSSGGGSSSCSWACANGCDGNGNCLGNEE
jgi:hypothetical protein